MNGPRRPAIAGGTGSFGSSMVDHLLIRDVDSVHTLSRAETKQAAMRGRFSDSHLTFFLGDVRDYHSVAAAFRDISFVFQAAALTQVPTCEFFPNRQSGVPADRHACHENRNIGRCQSPEESVTGHTR